MKKITALLIAFTLLCTLCLPALATVGITGGFWFNKTVDGTPITLWLSDNCTPEEGDEIQNGMRFDLYPEDEYPNGLYFSGTLQHDTVVFGLVPPGDYVLVERLEGLAAEVFLPREPEKITIAASGVDFDKTATYSAVTPGNTLSLRYEIAGGPSTISDAGGPDWAYPISDWFDDYHVSGGNGEYPSFCANYMSRQLGDVYVDKTSAFISNKGPAVYNNILSAFNYINDIWGGLDAWPGPDGQGKTVEESTKWIAQIALWLLLDDGVLTAESVGPPVIRMLQSIEPSVYPQWTAFNGMINNAVAEVIAAVRDGYVGQNNITEFVFLADPSYDSPFSWSHILSCQPQIVPIFGALNAFDTLDNAARKIPPENPTTHNYCGTLVTWRNNKTVLGGTFNNGMTYVEIDIEKARTEGYTFGIADSSPSNKYIDYNYFVRVEGNELIISFDDRLAAANVCAKLYSEPPDKHDPSHHTPLSNGQELRLPLPAIPNGSGGNSGNNSNSVTAEIEGNGNNRTLTITAGGVKYTNQPWSNNGNMIYALGGYKINVAIQGNKVSNITILEGPTDPIPQDPGAQQTVYLFFHLDNGISHF